MSLQTELKSMDKIVKLVHHELTTQNLSTETPNLVMANLLLDSDDVTAYFFQITRDDSRWKKTHNIDDDTQSALLDAIARKENEQHLIELNNDSFLWQQFTVQQYTFTYIKKTTTLDLTRSYVAKRLFITSILVFWISVWLALTLSSLIAKRAQEINDALAKIATHDALTGLPNRLFLMEELEDSLPIEDNKGKRSQGSLFVIDLDKFKEVNDSFGHSAGDTLLKEISLRLLEVVLPPNRLMRIGGDEFVIWAPNQTINEAEKLADALVNVCDSPILINGLAINTGASIGIAHYPTHTSDPETLIVCADTAMYKAKEQRSGWQLYDQTTITDYKRNLQLRAELNEAMSQKQIVLHYQPKVELNTGDVIGVEGLCRWEHPKLGLLSPGHFIDLIEDSGKVQEFGRYILDTAFKQASDWLQQNIRLPIAVNLSPYNLLDPGLVEFIRSRLQHYQIPPSCIEIELTENETCLNIKHIKSVLLDLHALGVSLAIDDFGTGMSSLAYLAQLNVDVLKIDRVFIHDIEDNSGHRSIVSSAITLSQSFGCKVVAEGVETESQAALLTRMGCPYAQGYLFAKPMEIADLAKWLQQNA